MEKFKYGIIAVELNKPDKDGLHEILHFEGYWSQPKIEDYNNLMEELKRDEKFGLKDVDFDLIHASQEIVDYYWEETQKSK